MPDPDTWVNSPLNKSSMLYDPYLTKSKRYRFLHITPGTSIPAPAFGYRGRRAASGQQEPPPFTIDPNQVQSDIAAGSGWGAPTIMPQMNPMYGQSMYQMGMPAFDANLFPWSPFLGGFK